MKEKRRCSIFFHFGGAGGQVVDHDVEADFVGQLLQFAFPQPYPRAVAAAAPSLRWGRLGGDQQSSGVGIARPPDGLPPLADAVHREGGRIMVNADTDPSGIRGQVIDPVRHRAAELLDQEVMDPDLFRVALGPIFAAVVTEIPDQFLFLGVDGDHRLLVGQSGGHVGVDAADLRIPVGVTVALCGLTVALQTVTRLIEQVADQGAADLVTLGLQRLRPTPHAFSGPPQRRSRVTPRRRLDQRLEIVKQRVVLGDRSPASSSRPPNALRGLVRRQSLRAPPEGARRNPGPHRDRRNPAITRGKRLRCRNQTPAAFIEKGRHRRKPLSNGFDIDHHHNIWYGKSVVNPYLTLSKVDSIISGRALSLWHVIGYVANALSSPPLTRNQVELMGQDNISKPDAPGFEALQISPQPIEIMLS